MLPFLNNTNNFELPLSGDNTQDISTNFFAAMVGVPQIEKEAVTKVASYGDQIGALSEVVMLLAEKAKLSGEEIDELKRISSEIKTIKDSNRAALRTNAEIALQRLKKADEDAFTEVIQSAST